MSLDDEIKRAFSRHEDDAAPVAFDDVTGQVAASNRRWAARTVMLTIALLAIGVAAVMQVARTDDGPGPRPTNFANPDGTPSPTPTPAVATYTFRDELEGWQVTVPEEWVMSHFEAHVEFRPEQDLPGLSSGEPTFAAEIWLEMGVRLGDSAADSGKSPWGDTSLGGRDAHVNESRGTRPKIAYLVDWSGNACNETACPDDTPATLHLTVFASNQELWDSYSEVGHEIVKSLQVTEGNYPAGSVRTRWGSMSNEIAYDAATQLVVRFLDARVAGGGAGAWITDNAGEEYASSLYRPGPKDSILTGWQLLERSDTPDGTVTFLAELILDQDGKRADVRELVTLSDEPDGEWRVTHYESANE